MQNRTPSKGLEILEHLYKENPNHQGITKSLTNAYIRLGLHNKAINLINNITYNKKDIKSLKFKAWVTHKQGNIEKEREIWKLIIRKHSYLEVDKQNNYFIPKFTGNIQNNKSDILLFCKVYNEIIRLPFFMEHYRNLGVTKFIFIDNNSTDGSLEFLLKQPDCYIFWTNENHSEAGAGTAWINQLMKKYAIEGQWCLYVDADEFLIYPNCEAQKLDTLIHTLEQNGDEGMVSYMLDIYPKNLETQLSIKSGDNIIEKSPYFYNNYVFYERVECPYQYPAGGIFSYFGMFVALTKTGLFKYHNNFWFLQSSHATTPFKVSKITSVYLHAKFLGNLYEKTQHELKRKEYWGGARAYQRYAEICQGSSGSNPYLSNLDKSIKYQDSQQLIDLGLIKY